MFVECCSCLYSKYHVRLHIISNHIWCELLTESSATLITSLTVNFCGPQNLKLQKTARVFSLGFKGMYQGYGGLYHYVTTLDWERDFRNRMKEENEYLCQCKRGHCDQCPNRCLINNSVCLPLFITVCHELMHTFTHVLSSAAVESVESLCFKHKYIRNNEWLKKLTRRKGVTLVVVPLS